MKVKAIVPLMMATVLLFALVFPNRLDLASWLDMTLAGVAMGMLIFLMSAGLSLVFGMMDILNFAHGMFFTMGGVAGWKMYRGFGSALFEIESAFSSVLILILFVLIAGMLSGLLGWFMEKVIIKRVYHNHLNQILVTMGVLVVSEEVFRLAGLKESEFVARPWWFLESLVVGQWFISWFQITVIFLGFCIYGLIHWVILRTKVGLVVRAGIENPEMVMVLGYNIKKVFSYVFVLGASLAGIGGVLWGFFNESVSADMGSNVQIFAFIVVIIGGLGSLGGSLLGALILGLSFNYIAYFFPELALVSNMLLMILILLWRPAGLVPVRK